jgi:CRP/FNR family cyclic AMP-dependent transcriptional regulator
MAEGSSAANAVERLFSENEMFLEVASSALAGLAEQGRLKRYRGGLLVYADGDPSDTVYCLIEGRIRIVSTTSDGQTQLHAVLTPGSIFGDLGVLGRQPRTSSAECLEDSVIWSIAGERFLRFLHDQPSAARELLAALARQVVAQDAMVEDLLFLGLKARVAKRLLGLVATSWDDLPPDGTALPWDISQTDLANLSGGSRENVNRILSEFHKRGYVKRSGRRYFLTNIKALRRIANV